jgi:lipoyl(octanoyl) transferase
MQTLKFQDLGLIDYKQGWDYQEELFVKVQEKREEPDARKDVGFLLFCEHPHVYTLGKSGQNNNLLIGEEMLKRINATYYHINRGGDITYHGPGQLVVYPILDLEALGITLKDYIHKLEEVIIRTLDTYGLKAERLNGATGVWLDKGIAGKERKICAIGVRASRYVTMHGLAFNVNTNLDYFNYINPCGFLDKGVTSMQKELGIEVDFEQLKVRVKERFAEVYSLTLN